MTWSTYCSIEKFDLQQLLDGKSQQLYINEFLNKRNKKSIFDILFSLILVFIVENGPRFI